MVIKIRTGIVINPRRTGRTCVARCLQEPRVFARSLSTTTHYPDLSLARARSRVVIICGLESEVERRVEGTERSESDPHELKYGFHPTDDSADFMGLDKIFIKKL